MYGLINLLQDSWLPEMLGNINRTHQANNTTQEEQNPSKDRLSNGVKQHKDLPSKLTSYVLTKYNLEIWYDCLLLFMTAHWNETQSVLSRLNSKIHSSPTFIFEVAHIVAMARIQRTMLA